MSRRACLIWFWILLTCSLANVAVVLTFLMVDGEFRWVNAIVATFNAAQAAIYMKWAQEATR